MGLSFKDQIGVCLTRTVVIAFVVVRLGLCLSAGVADSWNSLSPLTVQCCLDWLCRDTQLCHFLV